MQRDPHHSNPSSIMLSAPCKAERVTIFSNWLCGGAWVGNSSAFLLWTKFFLNQCFYPFCTPHSQLENIVNSFCLNMEPDSILEEGCAVVWSLCMKKDMKKLVFPSRVAEFDRDLLCAKMSGMTHQMHQSVNDAITDVGGPVHWQKMFKCLQNMLIIH